MMKYLYLLAIVALLGACGSDSTDTIGNSTVTIGNLEVMTKEVMSNRPALNWDDAIESYADLVDGWRLPTKDELNILFKNHDKIGGSRSFLNYCWCSKEYNSPNAWKEYCAYSTHTFNRNKDILYVR